MGFSSIWSKESKDDKSTYPQGINSTMNMGFNVPTHKDVDAEYERLIKNGATAFIPPVTTLWGHRDAYVADPEGNIIAINAVTE